MSERRRRLPVERLLHLRFSGIHIEEAAVTFEHIFHRVSTRDLRPSQLIFSTELGPRPQSVALQSLYSWVLGLILLLIALPVMAIVAFWWCDLARPGSVPPETRGLERSGVPGFQVPVHVQGCRGAHRARFGPPATIRASRLSENGCASCAWTNCRNCSTWSRGEMSLVGPRPERPEFVEILQEKIPYYAQRNCVKPGITGWAQINYKYGDTIEDSLTQVRVRPVLHQEPGRVTGSVHHLPYRQDHAPGPRRAVAHRTGRKRNPTISPRPPAADYPVCRGHA